MSTMTLIPESAPFSEEQRAWLNGFLSGLIGLTEESQRKDAARVAAGIMPASTMEAESVGTVESNLDEAPWHDASLPILERMQLAEGASTPARLMAAMAQLDCGSCGYLCQTYSLAIAKGEEKNLALCTPGGKETQKMLKRILQEEPALPSSPSVPSPQHGHANGSAQKTTPNPIITEPVWSRQNPYVARLIESRPLNQPGSNKDTRHVVIDLAGSGLSYQVGDALGIYPTNCGQLVSAIVQCLAAEPHTAVTTPAGLSKTLTEALRDDFCLRDPSDELLELLSQRIEHPSRQQLLRTYLDDGVPDGFDVLDALRLAAGATITATEFVETLVSVQPRLYSIASSMRHVGEQVHLTVGKVSYEIQGRVRKGVASTLLADRLRPGDSLRVFTQPNHGGFTVPSDTSRPIIMVGPGTGIAPFMAFLQERMSQQATGRNWLFFGDQQAACDFLYEDELRAFQSSGLLHRLDTAFSRDGAQKVYVQDRMRAQAAELWHWLDAGAHFYVCGDASRMAKDVDAAFKEIISGQSGMNESQVKDYVKQLASEGRYVRDVY